MSISSTAFLASLEKCTSYCGTNLRGISGEPASAEFVSKFWKKQVGNNTETMSIFLEEVSHRHVDERIIMFMDQAGWHKSKGLRLPENIELAYLPPYSPELNPEEQIWDELREKFFGNKLFKTLEHVMDTAAKGLQILEKSCERLKTLTHRDWMLNLF